MGQCPSSQSSYRVLVLLMCCCPGFVPVSQSVSQAVLWPSVFFLNLAKVSQRCICITQVIFYRSVNQVAPHCYLYRPTLTRPCSRVILRLPRASEDLGPCVPPVSTNPQRHRDGRPCTLPPTSVRTPVPNDLPHSRTCVMVVPIVLMLLFLAPKTRVCGLFVLLEM